MFIRWTPRSVAARMGPVSAGSLGARPSSTAAVALRSLGALKSNDCATATVRDRITAEFEALPFLGSLSCSAGTVVAGSVGEVVLTYTVGRSGIADSDG